MDVTGTIANRALHQRVDQIDDRTAIRHFVDGGVIVSHDILDDGKVCIHVAHQLDGIHVAGIGIVEGIENFLASRNHRPDTASGEFFHLVEHRHGLWIGSCEIHHTTQLLQRQHLQALGNALVDAADDFRIEDAGTQSHMGNLQLFAQRVQHVLLGYPALVDDDLSHAPGAALLQLDRLGNALLGQQATRQQDVAKALRTPCRRLPWRRL